MNNFLYLHPGGSGCSGGSRKEQLSITRKRPVRIGKSEYRIVCICIEIEGINGAVAIARIVHVTIEPAGPEHQTG